jgi:hypothetical protein
MLIFWGKRGGFESLIAHFPVWSDFAEKRIAEKLGFFVRSQDGLRRSTTRPYARCAGFCAASQPVLPLLIFTWQKLDCRESVACRATWIWPFQPLLGLAYLLA